MSASIEDDSQDQDLETYLDSFNKDIDEVTLSSETVEVLDGSEASTKKSPHDNDTKVADDEDGAYYMDEDGSLYFQPAENKASSSKKSAAKPATKVKRSARVAQAKKLASTAKETEKFVVIVNDNAKSKDTDEQSEQNVDELRNSDDEIYEFDEVDTTVEQPKDQSLIDRITKVVRLKPVSSAKADGAPALSCTHCSYTTAKAYLLSRHMKGHSDYRQFKCAVCERAFKTMAALNNHLNAHLGRKPHACSWCDMRFTTSGEMSRHVRYKHTHEKPHKCSECDYSSVELSKLRRHMRAHTGERPYQCPHCTYASPDTFKLKRHLRTHTGDRPYECDICHARFTQSNSLKAHRLIHSVGDKPVFQCSLCPTTCGRKTDLRLHVQKLHHSDHPIPCKRCGRELPDRYSYKMHMKTHDGERCYRCDLCPYASISQRNLDTHKLIHSDEKPHTCEICNKNFRQKQLLTRHMNLYHTEDYQPPPAREKSHKCPYCERCFAHKGNMLRHMNFHDSDRNVESTKLKLRSADKTRPQIVGNIEADGKFYTYDDDDDEEYPGEEEEFTEDAASDNFVDYEIIEADEEFEEKATPPEIAATVTKATKSNNSTTVHMELVEGDEEKECVIAVKQESSKEVLAVEVDEGEVHQYMIVKVLESGDEDDGDEDVTETNVEVIEVPAASGQQKVSLNSCFGFNYDGDNDSDEFIMEE